ncbi:hypothetical protein K4H00_26150, partial [Mycobacterium tuberculosis]|nr:hypothetical protein [Mycobacterium tuberculosis]
QSCGPAGRERIISENQCSHGDFILLSSSLPPRERRRTRAVAGADYWKRNKLRNILAKDLLNTVLVDRNWVERSEDPMVVM